MPPVRSTKLVQWFWIIFMMFVTYFKVVYTNINLNRIFPLNTGSYRIQHAFWSFWKTSRMQKIFPSRCSWHVWDGASGGGSWCQVRRWMVLTCLKMMWCNLIEIPLTMAFVQMHRSTVMSHKNQFNMMTSSHFLSFVTCQEACLGSNLGPRHSLKWHLIATSWHFMTAHTAYYLPQSQSEAKVKIHMTHESWQMDFRWLVTLVHLPCHSRSHDPFERLLWRVSVEVELASGATSKDKPACGKWGMGSRLEAAKGLSRPVLPGRSHRSQFGGLDECGLWQWLLDRCGEDGRWSNDNWNELEEDKWPAC